MLPFSNSDYICSVLSCSMNHQVLTSFNIIEVSHYTLHPRPYAYYLFLFAVWIYVMGGNLSQGRFKPEFKECKSCTLTTGLLISLLFSPLIYGLDLQGIICVRLIKKLKCIFSSFNQAYVLKLF